MVVSEVEVAQVWEEWKGCCQFLRACIRQNTSEYFSIRQHTSA